MYETMHRSLYWPLEANDVYLTVENFASCRKNHGYRKQIQERLRSAEEGMAELQANNERIESALKGVNEKLEMQVITLNGVHLTHTEEINQILIRLRDVEDRPDKLPTFLVERDEDIGELTAAELEERLKLYTKNEKHNKGNKHNSSRKLTVKSVSKERKKRTDKSKKK